ncbi:glycine-rich protein 2-like [Pyrus ussuriensis x Pyrus communis]|uniref:Glycine-rich protein 2-like n=1 Tax=Pyrus ussuriensis x Pyrus communis TaxID=2448454 RepID=A0A5N5FPF4_9ROSA|nr:glycine-rich protein 2-like [Pyrus ussuriensis x Pyrus communis]
MNKKTKKPHPTLSLSLVTVPGLVVATATPLLVTLPKHVPGRSGSGYRDSTDYSECKTDDYSEEGHGAAYNETTVYSNKGRRTGGCGYGGASNADSYSEEGHGGRATETIAFSGEGRRTGGGGYSDNTDYSGKGRRTSGGGGYGGESTDDYSEERHGGRRGYKKSDDDDSEEGHEGRDRGGYSNRSEMRNFLL